MYSALRALLRLCVLGVSPWLGVLLLFALGSPLRLSAQTTTKYFWDLSAETSFLPTDYLVGYRTAAAGGERRWSIASLRTDINSQLTVVNASGVNTDGLVDWSQLVNVPAGFADGTDATGDGGAGTWGSIAGTLADQTDLNTALGLKLSIATAASLYQPLDGDLTTLALIPATRNVDLGFALGTGTTLGATAQGVALGQAATINGPGGALGMGAAAVGGGAVGEDASSLGGNGFAGGASAVASAGGGAVGDTALAYDGFAGGESATAGAIGATAVGAATTAAASNSTALGSGAVVQAGATGAMQLGAGTNSTTNTLQWRTYLLFDASGILPSARLPTHAHSAADITSGLLAVARGGTGTATPALVAGTNVTITGTWPNQTINASGGGGTPGGSSTHVQYNQAGAFAGEAAFAYAQDTNTLTVDNLTVGAVVATSLDVGSQVFEGATADAFETTLGVVDPTADRTVNLPNASGTVALTSQLTETRSFFFEGANYGADVLVAQTGTMLMAITGACTITGWQMRGDVSGSVTVIVERAVGAGSFAEISGTGDPALSAELADVGGVTGWSATSCAAGDWIRFSITGTPASIKRINGALIFLK